MGRRETVMLDDKGRKPCPGCKEYKSLKAFYPAARRSFGVSSYCRKCQIRLHQKTYDYKKARAKQLRITYGITLEEYNHMLEAQGSVCAACEQPPVTRAGGRNGKNLLPPVLHVDHDHVTSTVRGLLCNECNTALGSLGENPDRVRGLLKYIERWSQCKAE